MSKMVNQKGYAYQSGGNVYFDTSKLTDYYKLTNHKVDEMVIGVRSLFAPLSILSSPESESLVKCPTSVMFITLFTS